MLRARHVDVVHSHGWDADVIAGLARCGLRPTHVAHQHILADWASSGRVVHGARRMVSRVAMSGATIIAVSDAVKRSLEPLRWIRPESVHVVRNGVDVARFATVGRPNDNAVPVIGVAARLAPMKGLEYVIDAVALLRRRGTHCKLRIAGEGPARERLERRVRETALSDSVSLLGHQWNMPAFYQSVDIVALPSVALEGLPLVILEAMAARRPVVATALSGVPEVITDGVTGVIVKPGDEEALADGLAPLLESGERRDRMGNAGHNHVAAQFQLQQMVSQVATIYATGQRTEGSARPSASSAVKAV